MELQRDLVIKVKYGDSLKRFTASVVRDNLDQDLAKLREKIILAFNISPSTDFILTYTDVDGDTVMLDDDEDLRDACINQKLNPLRINIQLKSQSTAPVTEPKPKATNVTQCPFNPSHISLEEALKSIPEPFNSRISKVVPVLNELRSALSKVAMPQASVPANVPADGSSSSAVHTKGSAPKASTNQTQASSAFVKSKEPTEVPVSEKGTNTGSANTTSFDKVPGANNEAENDTEINARGSLSCKGKSVMQMWDKVPFFGERPTPMMPMPHGPHHPPYALPRVQTIYAPRPPYVPDDSTDSAFSSNVNMNGSSSEIPPYPSRFIPPGHPYRKPDTHENFIRATHWGVACDGCDMTPIVGPRYKSIVKDDYDLCGPCFSQGGKVAEYIRIERPTPGRMIRDFNIHPKFHSPPPFGPARPKLRSKLESRFIQDVTVLDGTIMAPSTPFTKIWRMRNNGPTYWPFGTQLVWVGGDQFSSYSSVQLEIPVSGFAVDEEVDVAVDFFAPERAGRYISYWRLATPSGQKFGQRVWVLIQVEQPSTTKQGVKSNINLNLPPESCGLDVGETVEITELENTPEPMKKNIIQMEPIIDENQDPVIKTESEPAVVDVPNPVIPPTVSYPLIDLSPSPSNAPTAPAEMPVSEPLYQNEDLLLKELEEMGFKQIDLNKEVLRLNKYDLEQSVEDLCGFSEWDPLLEELKEMGFDDKEKNKKLLVKNAGSIKRVVMDLISGEKAE